MKYVKYGLLGGVSAVLVAGAVIAEEGNSIPPFEMDGKGEVSKFFSFELTSGANAMLHGYVPHNGDTVEWYVKDVKCDEPDKSCSFELAIRKHKKFWPLW